VDLNHIANIADKRANVRHACEAIIRWSYFNKEKYFIGKIFNFSRGGVYIETAYEIKPGSTIYIQLDKIISCNFNFLDPERPRLVSLGEVVWHANMDLSCYGAGVKYPFTD
jgi:hypothetical protein